MHEVIDSNLWILGSHYALMSSNQTNQTIVEKYAASAFKGERAKKRPDLLLLSGLHNDHVLIEFKKPDKPIGRDQDAQAQKYRDDLQKHFHPMRVLVVGGVIELGMRMNPSSATQYFSYSSLISAARTELSWLLASLSQSKPSRMLF